MYGGRDVLAAAAPLACYDEFFSMYVAMFATLSTARLSMKLIALAGTMPRGSMCTMLWIRVPFAPATSVGVNSVREKVMLHRTYVLSSGHAGWCVEQEKSVYASSRMGSSSVPGRVREDARVAVLHDSDVVRQVHDLALLVSRSIVCRRAAWLPVLPQVLLEYMQ